MKMEQLTPQEERRRELQSHLDYAKDRKAAARRHFATTIRAIEAEEAVLQRELTLLTQTCLDLPGA